MLKLVGIGFTNNTKIEQLLTKFSISEYVKINICFAMSGPTHRSVTSRNLPP